MITTIGNRIVSCVLWCLRRAHRGCGIYAGRGMDEDVTEDFRAIGCILGQSLRVSIVVEIQIETVGVDGRPTTKRPEINELPLTYQGN